MMHICGVEAVPLFLSEIAPARIRGGLNNLFQLNITVGILFATLVNYATNKIHPWGWRLSLSLAGIPASVLILCALLLVDTPSSLIERGRPEEGRAALKKIRGTDNVEPEFSEIVEASRAAREAKRPLRSLLRRRSRPQLAISVMLQDRLRPDASLYSAVIAGGVNVLSTLVSVYAVDRAGRRMLLLEGGAYMLLSLVAIAVVFGIKDRSDELGHDWAALVVVMVCVFVFSFAWSWGPLPWLIPSETFPLETRSAGQSVAVGVNMLLTFVFAQTFLSMLCRLRYTIFAFFSACVVVMSIFVLLFLPETKNVPIEEMTERVWKQHWFWKVFMASDETSSTNRSSSTAGRASEAAHSD
uniref:Major facilitator superfamily (MFS) profile domain-containing protein n=1 Tax=Oryza brachyantha TaxID=4533 RepID=J3NA33_ORYBR